MVNAKKNAKTKRAFVALEKTYERIKAGKYSGDTALSALLGTSFHYIGNIQKEFLPEWQEKLSEINKFIHEKL